MNVKNRLDLFLFIGHIAKIHIAYIAQISEIAKITVAHGIKSFLHTIVADAQVRLYMYHLSRHALRPATDVADILVVV